MNDRPCAIAGSSRLDSLLLLVSLAAAGVNGCTGMGTMTPPPIALRIEDAARWIEPADLHRYQCEQGVLVCTAGAGRLTTRLCRCVVSAGDSGDSLPQHEVDR
jgi:hypothetical protein